MESEQNQDLWGPIERDENQERDQPASLLNDVKKRARRRKLER